MVLSSGTAWPRRLLIAFVLAAVLLLRVPIGFHDASSVPQTIPAAAAAPSVVDNAKECAKNPIALVTSILGCTLAKGASGALKDAAGDGFKAIAKSMAQGWVRMIQLALAWFVKIPTPDYANDSVITDVQQATVKLQVYGLALSILIGSYKLIRARRQAVMNEAEESFTSLAKTVFGAWMFGGVLTVCTAASDSLSDWMLNQGTENSEQLIANLATANLLGLGSGLVFVVAICGILGGLLQAVLLIGRQAMLAVVVAVIPLVGSFGGTAVGKDAFTKLIKWTVALLLWKPVAAIVYWVAFRMAGHDVKSLKDAQMALMGLILLALSALVLPILMRLVSGGAAMSGGSGLQAGMMTAGVVAAAGTMVATGGASAAAGGASTAASAGATSGAAAGPSAGGGLSGGTGGAPPPGGGGGGGLSGGTGGGGMPPGRGGTGGGTGGGSPAPPPPGGGNSTDQLGGNSAGSGNGSSGTGGPSMGDAAMASNAVMSASEMLFDDGYESSSSAQEGSYR